MLKRIETDNLQTESGLDSHSFEPCMALDAILSTGHEHTTFYPEELRMILAKTPAIDSVEKIKQMVDLRIIDEKPFAIDLADEDRTLRALEGSSKGTSSYWDFFRDQIKYYATESYTDRAVYYRHGLVNDHGNLRLWIDALGKTAKDSYGEGVAKAIKLEWYQKRAQKEVQAVDEWEKQLQLHLGHHILVEISPGPYDVDPALLKGTTFKQDLSFVRFHQLKDNSLDPSEEPFVESYARKIHFSPEQLAQLMKQLSAEEMSPDQLLGRFIPLKGLVGDIDFGNDISDQRFPVWLQQQLEAISPELAVSTDDPDKQEDVRHFEELTPYLRKVFDILSYGQMADETHEDYLERAVTAFKEWENLFQARVSGEWEKKQQEFVGSSDVQHPETEAFLVQYFTSQQYKPPENSCGSGVGASGGSVNTSRSTILSGSSSVFNGLLQHENLSLLTLGKSVTIRCPECKESHKYRVNEIKKAKKLQCKGCSNCTDCWEPIVLAAMQAQTQSDGAL